MYNYTEITHLLHTQSKITHNMCNYTQDGNTGTIVWVSELK